MPIIGTHKVLKEQKPILKAMSSFGADMKTCDPDFPHHWNCQHAYGSGHPEDKYECTVKDGSSRVPDGSITSRSVIEQGGICLTYHSLTGGPPEVLEYLPTKD